MCQIKQKSTKVNRDKFDLSITCSISGKPISVSNKYGMFCEDMCELEACKSAEKKAKALIEKLLEMYPQATK